MTTRRVRRPEWPAYLGACLIAGGAALLDAGAPNVGMAILVLGAVIFGAYL